MKEKEEENFSTGEIAKFRDKIHSENMDEIFLDFGIGYWIGYPPPDIDGNHFGLHPEVRDNKIFNKICMITDQKIYKYAIPGLRPEILIQVIFNEKIAWVRKSELRKISS